MGKPTQAKNASMLCGSFGNGFETCFDLTQNAFASVAASVAGFAKVREFFLCSSVRILGRFRESGVDALALVPRLEVMTGSQEQSREGVVEVGLDFRCRDRLSIHFVGGLKLIKSQLSKICRKRNLLNGRKNTFNQRTRRLENLLEFVLSLFPHEFEAACKAW